MAEKVVYFLGAGFSAPLGIPTMSNFMEKAKDMYFEDSVKYNLFEDIFKKIKEMSYVKNYYEADLTNIEEIMSILQMQISLKENDIDKSFEEFIQKVIEHYTPDFEELNRADLGWYSKLFGKNNWRKYGYFISSLFNLKLELLNQGVSSDQLKRIKPDINKNSDKSYSIITTNYDLIFEKYAEFMNDKYLSKYQHTLTYNKGQESSLCIKPVLSKLHGCIRENTIIPPTWNKNINTDIQKAWNLAYNELRTANYIRIIGYSLPVTDSYLKYLFKSAIVNSEHLKKIDTLCLDPSGEIEKRYRDFIKFKNFRFKNIDLEDFFKKIEENTIGKKSNEMIFDKLESTHEEIFNN